MVIGNLVAAAALGVKRTLVEAKLLGDKSTPEEFRAACKQYIAKHGALRAFARYEQPAGIEWDDQKYRGEAYATYAWAIYVAEVAVDTTTYSAWIEDFVALQEIGRVLNPVLARGQIIGGVTQGIGLALYEKVEWRDGRMANSQMTNYIIPTSADVPPIRVFFEELGNPYGAFGAKGIGELPMDGPAPAVANALEDALGTAFNSVPVMSEDIFEAVNRAPMEQAREPAPTAGPAR
jgi:CO/xanthine dehydrogenase Mo-binding subunit